MPVSLDVDAVEVAHEAPPDTGAVDWPIRAGELSELGALETFAAAGGFRAKLAQTLLVPTDEGLRILVGLGDEPLTVAHLRRCAGALARAASKLPTVATHLAVAGVAHGLDARAAVSEVAQGLTLATYEFSATPRGHDAAASGPSSSRTARSGDVDEDDETDRSELTGAHIVLPAGMSDEQATAAISRADALVRGVALARDLVNQPGGSLTAQQLANVAVDALAPAPAEVPTPRWWADVWGPDELAAQRCGGILGVNAGSDAEPRLVRIVYVPDADAHSDTPADLRASHDAPRAIPADALWVIGKGITFDTGGLNIKTFEGMSTMKTDMGGAAAVAGTMAAVTRLLPSVPVVGVMCCTDNQPSPTAVMPGDVLRIRNNKTVEVLNTDAEGRLVLADGLSLAAEHEPRAVVDLATLTGACIVALGNEYAGLMGNDETLIGALSKAADDAGEHVWHLPLPKSYAKQLESQVADLRNIGKGRYGGALIAGLFLKEFVDEHPWAHLDIAGPVTTDEAEGDLTEGATGFGVRTLINWMEQQQ